MSVHSNLSKLNRYQIVCILLVFFIALVSIIDLFIKKSKPYHLNELALNLQEEFDNLYYKPIYYKSSDKSVIIEYKKPILAGENSGYISKVTICNNNIVCKLFKYSHLTGSINDSSMDSFKYFNLAISENSYIKGFICTDKSSDCISHIIFETDALFSSVESQLLIYKHLFNQAINLY